MDFTKPKYLNWIFNEKDIVFEDEIPLQSYRLSYDIKDDDILNDWAIHVRRHYKTDADLAEAIQTLNITEKDYLKENIIPQKHHNFGPQAISGEIAEMILYDIIEHFLGFLSLRGRHWNKPTPSSPVQGSDVMAVKILSDGNPLELCIIEVKALFTPESDREKNKNYSALVSAKKDSDKDSLRYSVSLNFMRGKYKDKGEKALMDIVARFQQKTKYKYKETFVAAGVISRDTIENKVIVGIKGKDLQITNSNKVLLIHGEKLMDLANEVYRRIIE